MVTLQKSGDSAVKFVFTDSDHYLYGNGELEVPVNSLLLVLDESEMVTFKKLSGDPFISFRADNSNLGTKAAIEQFYKDNMVGSNGGSESGVTSGDVETMIDTALDDYYDKTEVDAGFDSVNATLSDKADTAVVNQAISEVTQSILSVSGDVQTKLAITDFNTYSAATDSRLAEDEEVTAAALNDLQENKADTSAVTAAIDAAISGKADTSAVTAVANDVTVLSGAVDDTKAYYISFATLATQGITDNDWDGIVAAIDAHRPIYAGYPRQDGGIIYYGVECMNKNSGNTEIVMTASDNSAHYFYTFTKNGSNDYSYTVDTKPYVPDITTAITSGSTDSEIPTAKAVYDAIPTGGGATYSAGTNISIDTANTINCTLPIEQTFLTSVQDERYKCLWINPSNVKVWISDAAPSSTYLNYLRAAFSFGTNTIKATGKSAAFGQLNNVNGYDCFATGHYNNTNNYYEFASGAFNNSVTGSTASGQTLFSVGNGGQNDQQRHNALEIRQNGDIYFPDTDNTTYQNDYQKPMVRLQDMYGALGGLKLVSLTQSEYDNLATKSNDTLYIINNVVS